MKQTTTQSGWKLYDLSDAYAPRPPKKYGVDGLLALPSLSIFYGAPGTLKSLLVADLCACIVGGQPWLPPLAGKTGNVERATLQSHVLWVDLDNGLNNTHERIEAVARARQLQPGDGFHYMSMPNPWVDASDWMCMQTLAATAKSLDAKVIVFDCLCDASGSIDENSAQMGSVMSLLRRLAEETGCAVVVIHHQRKSKGDNKTRAGDSLRGHSSIEAAIDLALLILREPYSNEVKITATKTRGCDVAPFGAFFEFSHKFGTKELEIARFYGVEVEDLKSNRAIQRAILEVVKTNPKINKTNLTNMVKQRLPDGGINRIRSQIDYLVSQGTLAIETVGTTTEKLYTIATPDPYAAAMSP